MASRRRSAPRRRRRRATAPTAREAERKLAWLLCAPAVIAMLLVTGYPIVYAIYLSLQRYDLRFPDDREFVGLSNYVDVLTSSTWWQDVVQHADHHGRVAWRSSWCSGC